MQVLQDLHPLRRVHPFFQRNGKKIEKKSQEPAFSDGAKYGVFRRLPLLLLKTADDNGGIAGNGGIAVSLNANHAQKR
jgi:hypothetical protein